MNVITTDNIQLDIRLDSKLIADYLRNLVNQLFKILPMREAEEETLPIYVEGLYVELLGFSSMIAGQDNDHYAVSLAGICKYFITHPDCSVQLTKRQVFKAISLCNKLRAQFLEGGA